MNWEAIGSIAELLSALAVLLTLIYLSIQVRQTKRTLELSTLYESQREWTAVSRPLIEPENADVFVRGLRSFEELSAEDKVRFGELVGARFIVFAGNVSMSHAGITGLGESGEKNIESLLASPGVRQWWVRYCHFYATEVQDRVNQLMPADT